LPILEDTNLVLLDIRQPEEQAVSMLPHAMTLREFAERFRKGIPKGKRIVVYCTIGYRSGKYAMELAGQGIRAENLEGGVLAWSHAGGPFQVKNDAGLVTPTRRVHVFDKGWNFLHPDYEAVW
jgi:sodium/bile acid cotransporter 7